VRELLAVLVLALSSSACLVAPNPDFIDPLAEESESDTGLASCPDGLADCDGEPGCEAHLDDPLTCGSCNKRCEFASQLLECDAGTCVGEVMFTDLADAYVDTEQPQQNFGAEPVLIVDRERDSYIELPNLGTLPSSATIHAVTLHVPCTLTGANIDVYRIESPWDELAMTQQNAPGMGNSRLLTFSPQLGDNTLELVGLLPSWRLGNPKRSLGLTPASGSGSNPDPVEFSSREGAAASYLVLSLSW
jgi:hypothetical protein